MIHVVRRGRIYAHRECGEARGYVLDTDPPALPADDRDIARTFPARVDTGQSFADDAVSRGGAADRAATPAGALDAVAGAQDARPVAAGAEPHPGSPVDPDDTSHCPVALWCGVCESTAGLIVVTAESAVGVFCSTLCGDCADLGRAPRAGSWLEIVARVQEHAGHLGCTVDDLAPVTHF